MLKVEKDESRDLFLASEYVTVLRIQARSVYSDASSVATYIQQICQRLSNGEAPFLPSDL
jgi:very-short-patch-repair endonuclease